MKEGQRAKSTLLFTARPSMLKRDAQRIICTLVPASEKTETIEHMIRAGCDVFRLNMSHAQHDCRVYPAQVVEFLSVRGLHPHLQFQRNRSSRFVTTHPGEVNLAGRCL